MVFEQINPGMGPRGGGLFCDKMRTWYPEKAVSAMLEEQQKTPRQPCPQLVVRHKRQ